MGEYRSAISVPIGVPFTFDAECWRFAEMGHPSGT